MYDEHLRRGRLGPAEHCRAPVHRRSLDRVPLSLRRASHMAATCRSPASSMTSSTRLAFSLKTLHFTPFSSPQKSPNNLFSVSFFEVLPD
jgi:hypothetical protein